MNDVLFATGFLLLFVLLALGMNWNNPYWTEVRDNHWRMRNGYPVKNEERFW